MHHLFAALTPSWAHRLTHRCMVRLIKAHGQYSPGERCNRHKRCKEDHESLAHLTNLSSVPGTCSAEGQVPIAACEAHGVAESARMIIPVAQDCIEVKTDVMVLAERKLQEIIGTWKVGGSDLASPSKYVSDCTRISYLAYEQAYAASLRYCVMMLSVQFKTAR